MSGPYETERQAADAARHIYDSPADTAAWALANYDLLYAACVDAGVVLGDYDAQILRWLAGYEPTMCAVVAGLIARAHAAGQDTAGGSGTAQRGGGWISGPST